MAGRGWHHRGYLPHFDADDVVQHVVLRLADSLPVAVMRKLELMDAVARTRAVAEALDRGEGQAILREGASAEIASRALLHFNTERYALFAWCVMPNHVHALVGVHQGYELGAVVRSWKSYSAAKINASQGRSGRLWAPDYFDRHANGGAVSRHHRVH